MADDTNPVVTGGSSDSDAPYSNELRELGTIDPGEPASRNNRWGEDMFKTPFSWPGIPGL